MFLPKFSLYTLLLEALAWSGLLLDSHGDGALLLFLLAHGGACIIFAIAGLTLLPPAFSTPRVPALLLIATTAYALPVVGFVAAIAGILILRALPAQAGQDAFRAIALPEIDPHMRQGSGFRQAGMRSFLANSRAPVASRLRALVALQNISGRVATPLLRDVLTDPSEDIRLLAYGMLDNKEKHLNQAIHAESARFSQASADTRERGDAARRLADLYWELVYQELAQGDLRTHALEQSLQFTTIALQSAENDAGLHMRHARLLQSLGNTDAARAAYDRALALGMPKTRIVPYLAELAFDTGNFRQARTLMSELGDWQSLPRLQPVIRYWRRA